MSAKVSIVAAGPGDPGLLTVRGGELLRHAELLNPRVESQLVGSGIRLPTRALDVRYVSEPRSIVTAPIDVQFFASELLTASPDCLPGVRPVPVRQVQSATRRRRS